MASAEAMGHAAQNFLLFANILQTLKIDQLIVPETVAMTSTDVVLDCQYSAADDRFVLQWFVNGSASPVYRWRPWHEPEVQGVLKGRLDLKYRASTRIMESRRALRIVHLDPDLSGEYTCKITADDGAETARSSSMLVFRARLDPDLSGEYTCKITADVGEETARSFSMLVFSPEREFALMLCRNESAQDVEVKCVARGLHPQPDLTLEHESRPIPKQIQRVWRNSDSLFDAETSLRLSWARARSLQRLTCRLQLPQAGYVVMKEELLYPEHKPTNSAPIEQRSMLFILIYTFINMFLVNK